MMRCPFAGTVVDGKTHFAGDAESLVKLQPVRLAEEESGL